MNSNYIEFGKYRDTIKVKKQFSNGNESFNVEVTYLWKNKTKTENLVVTLSLTTFEYGRISLEEGMFLNSDIVHMDFEPNYQSYLFNKQMKSIEISGESQKMGKYMVNIVEI